MPDKAPRHRPHGLPRPIEHKDGNRHARGYDAQWVKLRAIKLQADPLCEACLKASKWTQATEVDHIERFDGIADPLRLSYSNLQSLCKACHVEKTISERKQDRAI